MAATAMVACHGERFVFGFVFGFEDVAFDYQLGSPGGAGFSVEK
jgi:hypothetical protein